MNAKSPTIVFWGTSEFALRPFQVLSKKFVVVAAITAPDKPAGRRNRLTPPPLKITAEKLAIPVYQPGTLKDENFKRELPIADLYVVCAYGTIIPQSLLELPKHGSLNIHPSLLPRWRGPSPIQAAVFAGDAKTGVTIIRMDEKMDHGPIVRQQECDVAGKNLSTPELSDILSEMSSALIAEVIPQWVDSTITPITQNESEATYCAMIKKEDGRIDWTQPSDAIDRHVRAFAGWPGSFTYWQRNNRATQLKIIKVRVPPGPCAAQGKPGGVRVDSGVLFVATGNGELEVLTLQPEGGKPMPADSFLRGHMNIHGELLGSQNLP